MTKELDAAIRAACERWPTVDGYRPCHYLEGCSCEMVPLRVKAAFRAALPAEPPPELIEAIAEAEDDEDVYRALRAHLLGEGAA